MSDIKQNIRSTIEKGIREIGYLIVMKVRQDVNEALDAALGDGLSKAVVELLDGTNHPAIKRPTPQPKKTKKPVRKAHRPAPKKAVTKAKEAGPKHRKPLTATPTSLEDMDRRIAELKAENDALRAQVQTH